MAVFLRQAALIAEQDLSSEKFSHWQDIDSVSNLNVCISYQDKIVLSIPQTSMEFAVAKIKTQETGPLLHTDIIDLELEGNPITQPTATFPRKVHKTSTYHNAGTFS